MPTTGSDRSRIGDAWAACPPPRLVHAFGIAGDRATDARPYEPPPRIRQGWSEVAVWDVDDVFPSLERTLAVMNQAQLPW